MIEDIIFSAFNVLVFFFFFTLPLKSKAFNLYSSSLKQPHLECSVLTCGQWLPYWSVQIQSLIKRSWCWERLKAKEEEGDRGWDGWMAPSIQWTGTWANSERWWETGRPGVLHSMGSQRVWYDLVTEQQYKNYVPDRES